jgi:hypothetical protein
VLAGALGMMLALVPSFALAHLWYVLPGCDGNPYENPYFYPGGPLSGWTIHNYADGEGNCHWRTFTKTSSTPVNTASWYLPISTSYNHFYVVEAFIPCDHQSTHAWKYRRYPNGTLSGFTVISRTTEGYCDELLGADIATYNGSNGGYIQLTDNEGTGYVVAACYLYYTT